MSNCTTCHSPSEFTVYRTTDIRCDFPNTVCIDHVNRYRTDRDRYTVISHDATTHALARAAFAETEVGSADMAEFADLAAKVYADSPYLLALLADVR